MDANSIRSLPERLGSYAGNRCGELGAWFLDIFLAFPRFVWREMLRPALCQRRLQRALADETRRLFYLQGVAPLQTHRSVMVACVTLFALVLGSQAAVYGLHASVEGIAAKLVVFTLVPGFTAFYVVLGTKVRWYVAMNRAMLRGEQRLWQQWETSLWLMQGVPQIAAAALSSLNLALLNLIALLFAEPLMGTVQHVLLPNVPPLNFSHYLTPGLFLLALAKAMVISSGVTAWFAFCVASAEKPDRDLGRIVGRTTLPFLFAWLVAEAISWWLAQL
ncbi:MAG: hypothetical protein WC073_00280 [Sterolibacterium sp.]